MSCTVAGWSPTATNGGRPAAAAGAFLARTGARVSDRPEDDPDVALGRAIVARDQLLARYSRGPIDNNDPRTWFPIGEEKQPEASIAPEILGALVGLALAWPVSSIPIYYPGQGGGMNPAQDALLIWLQIRHSPFSPS